MQDRLGKQRLHRSLERIFLCIASQFEAHWNLPRIFYKFMVQKGTADLQAMGHGHPVDLGEHLVREAEYGVQVQKTVQAVIAEHVGEKGFDLGF